MTSSTALRSVRPAPRGLLVPAVGGAVLYVGCVLLVQGRPGGPDAVHLLDATLGGLVQGFGVALLWWRSRQADTETRAWRDFAVGWTVYVLTETVADVLHLTATDHGWWFTFLQLGYVVPYAFFVRALGRLLWPQRVARRGYLLEAVAVLALLTALLGQFVVLPLAHHTDAPYLHLAYWVLLPAADVFIAANAAVVAAGAHRDHRWWVLAAGAGVVAVGDVLFCVGSVRDGTVDAVGHGLDAFWVVGVVLVGVSSVLAPRPTRVTRRDGQALHAVPVLVVTGSALLLFYCASRTAAAPVTASLGTLALAAGTAMLLRGQRDVVDLAAYRRAALVDHLTGVPNRRALVEELDRHVAAGAPVVLAVVDVDRFKAVNDALGHSAGDELLRQVVARLRAAVSHDAFVARLGGDELALLLPGADLGLAHAQLTGVHTAVRGAYALHGQRIHVGASIGLAAHPHQAGSTEDLLHVADLAMYGAKTHGDRVHVYDPADGDTTTGELLLAAQLRIALGLDEDGGPAEGGVLVLHYQPQVRTTDGRVEGAEALVRWRHPTRGLVPPLEFLGVVERHGLVPALAHHVLDAALRQAAEWDRAGHPVRVAVNLSATDLHDGHLPARVRAALRRHDVDASLLVLEITEDVAVEGSVQTSAVLREFAAMGVSLSIDDYGTGYSSPGYLRRSEFDEVKLDRSFVAGILTDPRSEAVVVSTIWLAHRLGARVVAEGVEDEETFAALGRLGCDLSQGFWHSRALPAAEFERWCRERTSTRSPAPRARPDLSSPDDPAAGTGRR